MTTQPNDPTTPTLTADDRAAIERGLAAEERERPKHDKFKRGSAVYTCKECGKRTRGTGEGEEQVGMCRACFDYASWENTHNDDDHETSGPVAGCLVCDAKQPKAEPKAKPAKGKPAAKPAKASKPAKKSAAKKPAAKNGKAKKPTEQDAAPRSHVAATALGEQLMALAAKAEKVEGAKAVATLAAKLAKGTLNHGWLVSLRDAVNALAANLRDANQKALAKQLTAANRAVRRMERATRSEAAV